ncbi:MAG: gamma-glutamylcyclotransferase [Silicimonas sp.]|nr:gamma-glutamylcyclotransferase [Silicimonas sp.]
MTSPYFFGYGSLVNRATHAYASAHTARITGWRRAWRHVEGRDVAFLTAVPDAETTIDGLIAAVPNADWQALDVREAWYTREIARDLTHQLEPAPEVHLYHAPAALHRPATVQHPVLLSYLDVVVQGYLTEFGEAGVTKFFDTTDGWEAPIRNDRDAPIYTRHQRLTVFESDLVDHHLARLGCRIF